MSDPNRVQSLLQALQRELSEVRVDSAQGQFPILDLLGNLRDSALQDPRLSQLQTCCAAAWERLVRIVESGKPFQDPEVSWLRGLGSELELLAGHGGQEVFSLGEVLNKATLDQPARLDNEPAEAIPEDPPLELNLEGDGELLREFITESREHLDNIEQGVLVLERRPQDGETLNTIFRAFHTFKGSAGFLNLIPINRLAHILESLLDLARQGKLVIGSKVTDLILRGRDTLKQFLDEMSAQTSGACAATPIRIPTSKLKREVLALLKEPSPEHQPIIPSTMAVAPGLQEETNSLPRPLEPGPGLATLPSELARNAPRARSGTKLAEQGTTVKVDTSKLDSILDLVGEMVIAQSLVAQHLGEIGEQNPQLGRNLVQLKRITRELQRVSMSMRLVTIRGTFHKMARVVRDLSDKQQKEVQLTTCGEDTELDRGMVEELNDPLLHMIRNSIDHGIEPPHVRVATGKPSLATIQLRAYHQGGNVVLEVADDGAGLNRDRILAKAVERGLTTNTAQHNDEDVFRFIFAAGFSTAEKVTDVSGRGVGLDVVRRNIERLRGCIDISSIPGQGTVFKITLPLTLAIIDGLIVKVGGERYILPTLSVRESFRPLPEMISTVHNRGEVVNVRGRLLPLLRLHECFGIERASTNPCEGIVVVVQSGANSRCLLVDGLVSKQEVVIKNLNDLMVHKNRALAGATILGDGRVGLILDVNWLVQQETTALSQAA